MKFSKRRLVKFLQWKLWDIWHWGEGIKAVYATRRRFNKNPPQINHPLPNALIISLTSYPPRYAFLELTLKSLLTQTVKPDRIILWIATRDFPNLPLSVLVLKERGLEIRETGDIGSYKKLVPCLKEFPDAFIVTADDDVYYPPDWLALLIAEWDGTTRHVVGHRGYYVETGPDGLPVSCKKWRQDPSQVSAGTKFFLPIGEGGIFYPPGSLNADTVNEDLFLKLAPDADDYWFYWMARLAGSHYTKVKTPWTKVNWPRSQKIALFKAPDLGALHDQKISNLIKAYGWIDF